MKYWQGYLWVIDVFGEDHIRAKVPLFLYYTIFMSTSLTR